MSEKNHVTGSERYITLASILENVEGSIEDESSMIDDPSSEMGAIAVLPDILQPAIPPPYAKERVMAHLQEPIVAIFVPDVRQSGSGD